MEAELKEIEGLLENVDTPLSSRGRLAKVKKYVKLIAPHVALVLVVCLYAVIGAWIFYALESPNEDRQKQLGKIRIDQRRKDLIRNMTAAKESLKVWRTTLESQLRFYNNDIYKAYKEQYVRYPDVRMLPHHEGRDEIRTKRHRKGKSRQERGEKLWTASSSLFFAATTMATIGYGNIVPATSSGRIACVIFALFGAPLAIITIGDLGKFLSECTIWLYKKMKRLKRRLRQKICSLTKGEEVEPESDASSRTTLDWDGFVMDKSQVPVLLVFAILLLYIAFGGVLFAFLEDWTYMDAFYYSFISLTTIGFGDIVPENHDYIVLMLLYLGVGLAVTTMCIDLVGIQYIQKIHYFGRKFRGTDLLHLLKRKRMIERRLAMGQGEEILQMYIQHIQQQVPEAVIVDHNKYDDEKESKSSVDWLIHDNIIRSVFKFDRVDAQKIATPSIRSIRSWRPHSIYSNSSASGRSMMYRRMQSRGESFAESGPSLSEHCSLSTEPSVHLRESYWDHYRSPSPSLQSFLYEFPPDYASIAAAAKSSRRIRSAPSTIFVPSLPPSVRSSSSLPPPDLPPQSSSAPPSARIPPPFHFLRRQHNPSLITSLHPLPTVSSSSPPLLPLSLPPPNSFEISEPFMLSKLAAQCDLIELAEDSFHFHSPPPIREDVKGEYHPPPQSPPAYAHVTMRTDQVIEPPVRIVPRLRLSPVTPRRLPTIIEGHLPLLRRKRMERALKRADPLNHIAWLNVSPRAKILDEVRKDLPRLFQHVRNAKKRRKENGGPSSSIVLVSPRNPIGLACMEDWDSYIRMLDEYSNKPLVRRAPTPPEVIILPQDDDIIEEEDEEEVEEEESQPLPEPLPEEEVFEEEETTEHALSPLAESSSEESESATGFDIDLGAFELVDSGLSAETLLSAEDPVLFHQDMPVHSVHHDTVQTEAALENLMAAPQSMLSEAVPPAMVDDNYCFVVDGDKIRMGDIMGDDQWWRHTSRPTKYFFSEDLRKFHRVNCITAKGKVISAKLATTNVAPLSPSAHSVSSTPRSSVSGASSSRLSVRPHGERSGDQLPLLHVYKVIRFYSFWKTCTSFHRIVTMIDKVSDEPHRPPGSAGSSSSSSTQPEFKKRLFVQYLWRNAKAIEKARVQKEFDPRRQRLLRFVADPKIKRKAFTQQPSTSSATNGNQ